MTTPRRFKGHDYLHGTDVEKSSTEWRGILVDAAYTRRVSGDMLVFKRLNGRLSLAFEIYDDGRLGRQERAAQ